MFPPERCDMRKEFVGNRGALRAQLLDRKVKVNGVPVHDRGRDQISDSNSGYSEGFSIV